MQWGTKAQGDVLLHRWGAICDEDVAPLSTNGLNSPIQAQSQVVEVAAERDETEGFVPRRIRSLEAICRMILLPRRVLDAVV